MVSTVRSEMSLGEQMQVDWIEFRKGKSPLYAFYAMPGFSRTSFVELAFFVPCAQLRLPPHCCERGATRAELKFLDKSKPMPVVEGNIARTGCFKVGGHLLTVQRSDNFPPPKAFSLACAARSCKHSSSSLHLRSSHLNSQYLLAVTCPSSFMGGNGPFKLPFYSLSFYQYLTKI